MKRFWVTGYDGIGNRVSGALTIEELADVYSSVSERGYGAITVRTYNENESVGKRIGGTVKVFLPKPKQ